MEMTVAGTAQDFHLIPSLPRTALARGITKSCAKVMLFFLSAKKKAKKLLGGPGGQRLWRKKSCISCLHSSSRMPPKSCALG